MIVHLTYRSIAREEQVMERRSKMKRWFGVSLILLGLVVNGCGNSVDLLHETSEVKVTVDRLYMALQKEDMTALSAIFAHDEDIVIFGLGPNERYTGWEAVKDMFQGQMDATEGLQTTLADQLIKVSNGGTGAWVSSLNRVTGQAGENRLEANYRNTIVLEKRGGKWLIVHIHMSRTEATG